VQKPKNEQVKKHLEDIMMLNEEQYYIIQELRKIVFTIHPKTDERIMYGGIMFSLDDDFGGIFTRKNHISFEFGNGFLFDDPDKLLEGGGKYRRHLKIRSSIDTAEKRVSFFVKQAVL
jgi:hypothetical protein